ncbi:MAG: quercetin 2,3-dioxygenase [Alteromonadaceae bacterium]|nr:MAG: quercetin 2,3-dioxygenase [Alteromonadaceae bacterium]
MSTRQASEQIQAVASTDGDGVKLLRVFGGQDPERFDPFLMMDEFGSEEANDYIGGFPSHPHRGFSTITYMLQGKMEHRDHMDNVGLLQDGDVQWMTAGSGVIHSEMPKQTEGKMRGFQVWLNLPASKKMQAANYEDVPANKIPLYNFEQGQIKAIAGKTEIQGEQVRGYFDIADTQALYLDIALKPKGKFSIPVAAGHTALAYVYEGEAILGEANTPTRSQYLSRLTGSGDIQIRNLQETTAKVIVLAGQPLKEPIVQHGPFVMNSVEQIETAIQDYRDGTLTNAEHIQG